MNMDASLPDDDQLEHIAEKFRIFGEPMRLRILSALNDAEMSVAELVQATGSIADPTVFELCRRVCEGSRDLQPALPAFTESP